MKSQRISHVRVALLAVVAAGCSAGDPAALGDPGLAPLSGGSGSADPVCVTIQRGLHGSVADALINAGNGADGAADKNYGGSNSLTASIGSAGQRQALLRFDLSEIPPDATVTSATVTLDVLTGGGAPVQAHRATASWSEATVTWNSFGEAYLPQVEATFPAGSPTSADLTSLVGAWVSGAAPNDGLLLERGASGSTVFASSEYVQEDRPALTVCYVPSLESTCATILAASPSSPDGVYTIQPPGAPAPFDAYCDMTTDGGGWTLMATLHTTNVSASNTSATSVWGSWSDDWFSQDHGSPADPTNAFSNQDARKFQGIVGPSTVLRATTPAGSPSRYHFGFQPSDWAYWNASRYIGTVNVIGPFDLPNVLVSTSPGLGGAVPAQVNGHWFNGAFLLGTAANGFDLDTEGLGARYHVGSVANGLQSWAAGQRVDAYWHLWLR